jgi:hypothetical protein
MFVRGRFISLLLVFCAVLSVQPRDTRSILQSKISSSAEHNIAQTYAELPLSFEINQGQVDSSVKFLSRSKGATVLLSPTETVLALGRREASLRMQLVGANPDVTMSGLNELPGKTNYFIGSDPQKWRTNVSTYAKVRYDDVYPGIDLVYYGNHRQLEYDFVVNPGADPERIRFNLTGADDLEVDAQGDLVLHLPGGNVRQHKPIVYQEVDGVRQELSGGYLLNNSSEVAFQIASYDRNKPLVIDPVVNYSTYFGGAGFDFPLGIAVDSGGNAYVAGGTSSTDFPLTGAVQSSFGGGTGESVGEPVDMFVIKINAAGSAVLYSTYLGGSGDDLANTIAVDAAGNAYVTGDTASTNFPVTAGAFRTTSAGKRDVTVTKVSPTGSALVYSTYIGGAEHDEALAIVVDSAGNAYLGGETESRQNFPTTEGAYQRTFAPNAPVPMGTFGPPNSGEGFVTKLNAAGSALVYSTYLGGSYDDEVNGIALDDAGNAYVVGDTRSTNFPTTSGVLQSSHAGGADDLFVAKINPGGSALIFSTYLGGSGQDRGSGIAVDGSGNVYVVGGTVSSNFPTTSGAVQRAFGGQGPCGIVDNLLCGDGFVSKLNPTATALVYSTYLGGSKADHAAGIKVSSAGAAFVVGATHSTNFPTAAPVQAANANATGCRPQLFPDHDCADVFVTNLDASGALFYSTYLGGAGDDVGSGIAIDATGTAHVIGVTLSDNFPTTNPIQNALKGVADGFIVKITGGTTGSGGGSTGGGGTGGGGTGGGGTGGGTSAPTYSLANRGAVSLTTAGGSGPLSVGYARIQPTAGNTTPAGVAIFGFRQNNILVSEAGVQASPLVQSGRIYAQVGGAVNTGLAIANPNSQSATISFMFTTQDGTNFGSGTTTIPANGQIAGFLDQEPYKSGPSVDGTFTFTSNVPVAVVALRGLTNERSEFLLTTLPVSPLSAPTGEVVYFPDFADGGGWSTQLVLVNPTDEVLTGAIQFWGQGTFSAAAQPTAVTVAGQSNSTFNYTIPARSSRRFQTAGQGPGTLVGSVRVTPAAGNKTPSGLAVFSFKNGGVTVAEAGVPSTRTGQAFRLYAEARDAANGSIQTGIAIANPSASNALLSFELTNMAGQSVGLSGSYTVPANGQVALFLNQIPGFQSLATPFQGVLRVSTTSAGIAVVGLRSRINERQDFLITTTPSIDEAGPSTTAELVFPHFADGGGYTTQFILMSGTAGQSAAGTLRLYTQTGEALTLTLR